MTDTTPDMVNHPPHYQGAGGLEAIDVIEMYDLGYHLGNAFKYLVRAGKKGSAVEDLRKAEWYLDRWLNSPGASLPAPGKIRHSDAAAEDIALAFSVDGYSTVAVIKLLDATVSYASQVISAEMFATAIEEASLAVDLEINLREAAP